MDITLEITEVETEKSFDTPIGSVDSRFDLFAEDKKNRIIVNIQHVRNADHDHRFLHCHCSALLEQVVKSKDYHPKLEVYTIVVLTSGDKHKMEKGEKQKALEIAKTLLDVLDIETISLKTGLSVEEILSIS